MVSLANKVIGITGGASGIGLALAKLLASRGAILSLADVSTDNLDKAVASIKELAPNSEAVLTTQCDVRDPAQLESWINRTVEKHGKLDGAANLAGILGSIKSKTHEMEQANWDRVIGINLTGVMNSMRAELKVMTAGASIVNAGSAAGFHGAIGAAAYCASKHGVHGLTKVAAKEYGSSKIRINAVAPGYIWTPMQEDVAANVGKSNLDTAVEAMPIPRYGTAEEVANLVAFLLSDESSFITGSIHSVDGGWHT